MADWIEAVRADAGAGAVADRDLRFDRPPAPPQRERRAHARAHLYWQRLRADRRLPDIAAVEPPALRSFAANSVLFEIAGPGEPAVIRFIGTSLAAEAGADPERPRGIVPTPGSVLCELAERLPLIAATGAPLDIEAEFNGRSGTPTLYRGVLLPFADAGGRPAYVYGVITWKMIETAALGEDVQLAVGSALALSPAIPVGTPWDRPLSAVEIPDGTIGQRIEAARTWAALAGADHARRATSLHAALSAAYDLLVAGPMPSDEHGIAAVIDLVFGGEGSAYLGEGAASGHHAVLTRACTLRLGTGTLAGMLDRHDGGVAGFLAVAAMPPTPWSGQPSLTLSAIDRDWLATSASDRCEGTSPPPIAMAG